MVLNHYQQPISPPQVDRKELVHVDKTPDICDNKGQGKCYQLLKLITLNKTFIVLDITEPNLKENNIKCIVTPNIL